MLIVRPAGGKRACQGGSQKEEVRPLWFARVALVKITCMQRITRCAKRPPSYSRERRVELRNHGLAFCFASAFPPLAPAPSVRVRAKYETSRPSRARVSERVSEWDGGREGEREEGRTDGRTDGKGLRLPGKISQAAVAATAAAIQNGTGNGQGAELGGSIFP